MGFLDRFRRAPAPSRQAPPAAASKVAAPPSPPAEVTEAPADAEAAATVRSAPARQSAPSIPGLVDFFAHDHRDCDEGWLTVERAATANDLPGAAEALNAFQGRMLRHLAMEEEVMFPAFEAATGMQGGPTAVMRTEHDQMRALLSEMSEASDDGDLDGVLDQGDTLMMLIQQHNSKEEGMLYPMAQQALSAQWAGLHDQLTELES